MLPRCADTTILTDTETATLTPDGPVQLALMETEESAEEFRCELQAAHPDRHAGYVQDGDDEMVWWVRWGPGGPRELVTVPNDDHCQGELPEDELVCTLLEHWGGHCFELEGGQ